MKWEYRVVARGHLGKTGTLLYDSAVEQMQETALRRHKFGLIGGGVLPKGYGSDLAAFLSELGADGWELVSETYVAADKDQHVGGLHWYTFKRSVA